MSNYKRNTSSDRDALFGSSGGGGSKHKREAASNRDALFGGKQGDGSSRAARPSNSSSHSTDLSAPALTAKGYQPRKKTSSAPGTRYAPTLSGEARAAKMKEAEDYRAKAKKAMQRGVFAKADPVAASMYYKRAADAYQMVGEDRLERIHRVASADCQMQQGAYATAAADYTRAAELVKESDEPAEQKRKEGCKLYNDAANAFQQMGETGKAADCMVSAALALMWDDETTFLSKEALAKMEEAVEAHVPDPLNRYARYRQLGVSAFDDPESESDVPTAETMALAKDHMITKAYAHEPLHKLVKVFCQYGEYASALYATGAATAMLESDGISTRTLSQNYIRETILFLAMGDPVAAERAFLDWHVQKTFYLTSRECKLAEELFRAVLSRDPDALEEARSPTGSNQAALANLDESMRTLAQQLRISGVARRQAPKTSAKAKKKVDDELKELQQFEPPVPVTNKTLEPPVATAVDAVTATKTDVDSESTDSDNDESSYDSDEDKMDAEALRTEMDDLMNDLGLGDDSEGSVDDDDDDDIDLR